MRRFLFVVGFIMLTVFGGAAASSAASDGTPPPFPDYKGGFSWGFEPRSA